MTKRAVHIRLGDKDSGNHVFMANWNDFRAGQKGIRYGEPATFCVASYFEIEERDFEKCHRLKIILTDFLGRKYQKVIDDAFFAKDPLARFLIQE